MPTEQVYFDPDDEAWSPSGREKLLAWSAHLFTATGAIWGLLALLAITNQEWVVAFAWMGVAVFVDSFDGYLARRMRVKQVLPEFDGALLDNMVDFLNYVFVPAFFLCQADILPPAISLIGATLILLTSAYQFCQNDAKTEDHFFTGFPSYWNIMVYYMFILSLDGWISLAIILLCSALVFVPVKYIYPSRTEMHRSLTMALACLWGLVNIVILIQYPTPQPWLVLASLLFVVYYTGMSLYAMWRQKRSEAG
jgi:phosphatidylcholine synthase